MLRGLFIPQAGEFRKLCFLVTIWFHLLSMLLFICPHLISALFRHLLSQFKGARIWNRIFSSKTATFRVIQLWGLRALDALQNNFESPLCAHDDYALSREKKHCGYIYRPALWFYETSQDDVTLKCALLPSHCLLSLLMLRWSRKYWRQYNTTNMQSSNTGPTVWFRKDIFQQLLPICFVNISILCFEHLFMVVTLPSY